MVSLKHRIRNRKKSSYHLFPAVVQATQKIATERTYHLPCAYCHREEQPGWALHLESHTVRVLLAPLALGQELKLCTACKLLLDE